MINIVCKALIYIGFLIAYPLFSGIKTVEKDLLEAITKNDVIKVRDAARELQKYKGFKGYCPDVGRIKLERDYVCGSNKNFYPLIYSIYCYRNFF